LNKIKTKTKHEHVSKHDKLFGFNTDAKNFPIILGEHSKTTNSKLIFLDDQSDHDTIEQIARNKSMHTLTDIEKECVSILCDALIKIPDLVI
jgi:hypothetical protein